MFFELITIPSTNTSKMKYRCIEYFVFNSDLCLLNVGIYGIEGCMAYIFRATVSVLTSIL